MFKKFVLVIAVVIMASATISAQKTKKTKSAIAKPPTVKKISYIEDRDEYAVYQAVLRERFQHKIGQTIILNKEVAGCSTVINSAAEAQFSRDALEELFSDCYRKKNGNYELVGNYFQTDEKIILVSEDELGKIFVPTCDTGWRKFYRKYPNSVGNTSFSRVGFNSAKTIAVVNFGNQAGCLAGGGQIVFLQKENEIWKVKKSQPTWVS